MGLESLENIARARQEVVLEILVRAENNRESRREAALKEVKETSVGAEAIHRAYIVGVEIAFDFIWGELKKVIEVENEAQETEKEVKDKFNIVADSSDMSIEQAFDFGYKNACSAFRDLETSN
jgi:hypothetical protein